MKSKLSIVEAVLETNVQVDVLDEKQNTPLHLAVGNDNTNFDIIKKLLNSGADINAKNSYNNTPLHISAKLKPNVIEELLKWSPDIDTRNFNGDTPLTVAIRFSACPDIVKCLLKAGADPNCKNVSNNTPLQLAVENCHIVINVAKEIIVDFVRHNIRAATSKVKSYLDFFKKDANSLKKCLDHISTVNPPSIEESRRSNLLTVEYLLAYGAEINYKALQGLSPLDIATKMLESQKDNGSCVKLLIKYAVLRNYANNSYEKIVDLNGYKSLNCYKELANYLECCITEVKRLNKDRIKSLSLYEYLTKRNYCAAVENSGSDGEGSGSIEDDPQIVDVIIASVAKKKYPIYEEILINSVKKSTYLSKMMNHSIYCYVEDRESEEGKKKFSLRPDDTLCVMKYLKRSDLLNLALAFFYNINEVVLPETPKEMVIP
ncbi:ankyrin-1 [Trichonephila inaurata madagascariensis]|uniref:Ankyrin repeat domain-containing protein 54 n=1 Tax=Trichonephila inaurata madagascariensis TaxID=2747483 RepID=A0A8X7BTE0_9ARAC|nr:ankyrin-1 [Trichonephila inaurata madagascariensis]